MLTLRRFLHHNTIFLKIKVARHNPSFNKFILFRSCIQKKDYILIIQYRASQGFIKCPPIINEHHFNLFSNRPIHVKFFYMIFILIQVFILLCLKVGLYGIMIKAFFRHFLIFSLNSLFLDSFSFQKTLSMLNLFSSEMCISPRPINDKNESSTKICTLFNYVSLYVFYSKR